MEKGNIFDKRYELERRLGGGGYSEVWLAKDIKTDVEVALKIFAPSSDFDNDGLDMFAREFALVADINDPNILKPLYFESERKPYLVLQYCKQGSLKGYEGKIHEEEAWKIIHDVAKGLKALHSHTPNPIIHQDIKPENILISDDGRYMITDFGVSVHLLSTIRKTIQKTMSIELADAGTCAYMAPERMGKGRFTPIMPSDVWSLGAMVFELLVGEVPFGEKGGMAQKSGYDIPEIPGDYSDDLKNVIERCLAEKPANRPFVEELEEIANSHIYSPKTPTPKPTPQQSNRHNALRLWILAAAICGALSGILLALFF